MLFKTIKFQLNKHLRPYINENVILNLRKYIDIVELNLNATLGRHFLPHPRHTLKIETSGVCNLSCKFCSYSKKELGKVIMPMNLFQEVVNQAADMGYSVINLTPMTGDIFMDKGILEKMQYLDNYPKIREYIFYTNFVVPSEQKIEELFKLRKLKLIRVSVYGHDEKSFCDLTGATKKEYHRLVRNLKYLYESYHQNLSFELEIHQRTVPGFYKKHLLHSELQEVVLNFENIYNIVCETLFIYNNQSGEITNEDVKDIGLKVNDGSNVYKKGLCSIIFQRAGVLADANVDICVCQDVKNSLVVGSIKKKPLSYILSLKNPLYADLIQEQMENKFRPVCKNCSIYQSIYKSRRWENFNLNQVKALLNMR
jgi:MoaA/NifB/PqqE/SkfB family radical SAM enzyme